MEYLSIVDENNNPIGIVKEKEQAHKEGYFHRSVHIWIINDNSEILLQKRAPDQKYPNKWDISSAGHIKAGEGNVEAAIREADEELGININENELDFIGINKSDKPNNKEFQYIYLYRTNKKENEFIFRDGEVSSVKYFSYEEFKEMVLNKDESLHFTTAEEYERILKCVKERI